MITCADLEDWVANYLDGSLPLPKRRELERHLGECEGCREVPGGLPTDGLGCEEGPAVLKLPSPSAGAARSSDPRVAPAMTFLSLTINWSMWS